MSAPCLPCGLTPDQVIVGLGEVLALGLDALGQPELAALVPLAEKLAEAVANLAAAPSPATDVAAADAAADAAERAKFGP